MPTTDRPRARATVMLLPIAALASACGGGRVAEPAPLLASRPALAIEPTGTSAAPTATTAPTPAPSEPPLAQGAVFVAIGASSAANDAALEAAVREAIQATLADALPTARVSWPGGPPTLAQLEANGSRGFKVAGRLLDLSERETGAVIAVTCEASVLVSGYPDDTILGIANGRVSTQAGSREALEGARRACVRGVLAALVRQKAIPKIQEAP